MLRRRSKQLIVAGLTGLLGVMVSGIPSAFAQGGVTTNIADLALDAPISSSLKLSGDLAQANGRVQVVVRLSEAHSGTRKGNGAAAQRRQAVSVDVQQDNVIAFAKSIDPSVTVLGSTRVVLNAVMLDIEAAALPALASSADVVGVDAVVNYERDLSETVPYIGASPAVQNAANNGAGVRVAVLDSGIDYTHIAFGGAGTLDAYEAAYGTSTADPANTTRDGLFPTERVVDGWDFVGEVWPNGPLLPDNDPIDLEGHGTHVADIIGGALGVAPGVDLLGVKVCSAVSSSCSGVAILQGIDFSADPNGDGDTSDAVDVINMSLGAPYGNNYDNSSAIAVDNASAIGILTVASAGNSADKPYITGTPAGAYTALSVAQTEVPSSQLQIAELNSSAVSNVSIGAVFQPWAAPLSGVVSGPVQYGNGAGGNTLGCDAFPAGSLTGKVVIVDRGVCGFSVKIWNINQGGAAAGIIALVDTSQPFTGGFTPVPTPISIPGYMIRQVDANAIRAQIANGGTITFDPANRQALTGTVVGSSSRGPTLGPMSRGGLVQYGQLIKPEIGAPGASISAIAGSGTGTEAFGGTSGAAPMVAGAAALLINATNGELAPAEVKSRLMNTAETAIFNTPAIFGGALAPITRIGGGEVRIDRAMDAAAAAWEVNNQSAALSFGLVDVTKATTNLRRTVLVRNYSNQSITYNITPSFRYADDASNGAVEVSAPQQIRVPANSTRSFQVRLKIDGSKLPAWVLGSGTTGASGDALSAVEFDGYIDLTSSNPANNLHLAWQVLPRQSGNIVGPTAVNLGTPVELTNNGIGPANLNAYALIGSSNVQDPGGAPGFGDVAMNLQHVGVASFANACGAGNPAIQFAANMFERTTHAVAPAQVRINLDTDRDGVADFQVRNADFTLNALTDGRTLAWVINLRTGAAGAFFFAEHAMNSANMVLTVCGSQLADPTRPAALGGPLAAPSAGQLIDARAATFDNYFTGIEKSVIDGMTFEMLGGKYSTTLSDIPAGGSAALTVNATGSTAATSESGVLILTNSFRGTAFGGAAEGNEALVISIK